MKRKNVTLLGLTPLLFSISLWSQGGGGTISGIVLDPTGAVIPNAGVEATNTATGVAFKMNTTTAGKFAFPVVQAGAYRVNVTAAGFAPQVQDGVIVALNQNTALQITLAVGNVQQTVQVTAAAAQLQPETAEASTGIDNGTYDRLPLSVNGQARNPLTFMLLIPGAVVQGTDYIALGWNTSINGSQQQTLSLEVDGAVVHTTHVTGDVRQAAVPVDAVQEFTVITNNYSAQYGETGGGIATLVMKSGTNQFHGMGYEFLRNNKLDARGFFSSAVPMNRQNEYGANLGGPVKIPHLYDGKDRTFFFGYWGGFKLRQTAGNSFVTIPSTQELGGDFSDLRDGSGNLIPIYDPASTGPDGKGGFKRRQFSNNAIPPSQISPVAQAVVKLLPTRTLDRAVNNLITSGKNGTDLYNWGFKLDHSLSAKNIIHGFYGYQNSLGNEGAPSVFQGQLNDGRFESRLNYLARINDDYTLRPNLLNHFTIGFNRQAHTFFYKNTGNPPFNFPGMLPEGTIAFSFRASCRALCGPDILPRGSTGNLFHENENATNLEDWVSWIKGRHSLKIGGGYRWNGANYTYPSGQNISFSYLETSLPNSPNRALTGEDFASFLLGVGDTGSLNYPLVAAPRWRSFHTFAQDDIKVTNRLTLNIGLRYDVPWTRFEAYDRSWSFDPGTVNPATGTLGASIFGGSGPGRGARRRLADTYYKDFQPRFGFAYQLNRKTVVRGGYGIMSVLSGDTSENVDGANFSFPWTTTFGVSSLDTGITPAFNFTQGFPTSFPRPPFIDPTYLYSGGTIYLARSDGHPGRVQNWSFGIQRELPGSMLVEANYIATTGHHLGGGLINDNQVNPKSLSIGAALNAQLDSPEGKATGVPLPFPSFKGTVAQALRPYPFYSFISHPSQNVGNSNYNSFQLKVQRRFSRGLSVLASYTASKSLTDAEQSLGIFDSGGQDTFNRKLEKSLSKTDLPQYVTVSYIYELPVGKGKPLLSQGGIVDKVLGGWGTSGILVYHSGFPQRVGVSNTLPLFNGELRANRVAGVSPRTSVSCSSLDPARDIYANAAAFAIPAPFTIGNSPRTNPDLRNCPVYNEQMSLFKVLRFREAASMDIRWEAFNVFNRVRFSGLSTNRSAPASFGHMGGQGNQPRIMQFSLKLRF